MALVRLDPASVPDIDDHERPTRKESLLSRLWSRTPLPTTQQALFLYADGRCVVSAAMDFVNPVDVPDEIIAGGYEWVGDSDSWQAHVLSNHGYTLIAL